MDNVIWKLIEKWSYFLGNVLVRIRVAFLSDCPLVLSLLKYKGIGAFLNKKMRNLNKRAPLNSSIDIEV